MRDDDELLATPGLEFGSGVIGVCDICHRRQAVIVLQKERFQLCVIDFLNKTFVGSKVTPGRPLPVYRSERIWYPTDATSEGKAPAIVLSPTKTVKRPLVLLTPDIYGLTTTLLDAAIRFAREGYEVVLPDVGKTSSVGPLDHVSLRLGGTFGGGIAVDAARVRRLVGLYRDALRYGRSRELVDPTKTALFGVSFGGALAVALAGEDRTLTALALAYPVPVKPVTFPSLVNAPVLVVTASRDRNGPPARTQFGGATASPGATVEFFEAPNVGAHFLARDLGAYDLATAEATWVRIGAFLKSRLAPPPPKPPVKPAAAPSSPSSSPPTSGAATPGKSPSVASAAAPTPAAPAPA